MNLNPFQIISYVKNPFKKLLLILILVLLLFFLLTLVTKPLRIRWSTNYLHSGDEKLSNKQYLPAEVEYQKSLALFWGNKEARERIILSKSAEANVWALLPFYEETGEEEKLNTLKAGKAIPKNSLEAVKNSRSSILKEEYQIAIAEAETATKMDQGYTEAWLYLGVANYKAASLLQISADSKNEYLSESKKALLKALLLDSTNSDAKAYLKAVESGKHGR